MFDDVIKYLLLKALFYILLSLIYQFGEETSWTVQSKYQDSNFCTSFVFLQVRQSYYLVARQKVVFPRGRKQSQGAYAKVERFFFKYL